MNSPLPDKVNLKKDSSKMQLKKGIPKLDLTKAWKIQDINAKRSTQQAQQAQGNLFEGKFAEKIKKFNFYTFFLKKIKLFFISFLKKIYNNKF